MRSDVGDVRDGIPFPCGQCLACRINKRRVWTLRLLLESYYYPCASFVTLTYEPDNLPFNLDGKPILCKRDLQLFLKRLRYELKGREIKYYFAGEYGPRGHLPHYHGILFGVSPFELDKDWMYFGGKSGPYKPNFCRSTLLYRTWGLGIVHVGECTKDSIQYCAGYVTKKITSKGDGLEKEFQLMSRRPGIGSRAVAEIARALQKVPSDCLESGAGKAVRVAGKMWPLGRYLLDKLRVVSDVSDGLEDYIQSLRESWKESQRKGRDFLEFLVESDSQKFVNLEAKQKIFHRRKDL